ncbi:hypothetical protein [Fluviicola chungangensis]|uniref:Uncharacterized protein n=1 Tax=Fluviicola chungangensis TaxID=2597671 RepID=A0A556N789_9FLAO|nr:hypothetical protein [Fluviicola chungangensis]TSJ48025.1 hypothetical protein FO442_02525 [Fluviicola chungangensis]
MKIIGKCSLKLIILQCLSLSLFEVVFFRFHTFLNADLYECLIRSKGDPSTGCLEQFMGTDVTIGQVMSQMFYSLFYGFCFGVVSVIVINLIRKKSVWNTVSVVLLYLILFFTGAFKNRILDSLIYSFGRLFSEKIGISNLITSQVALLIALVLLWLSVKEKERVYKN